MKVLQKLRCIVAVGLTAAVLCGCQGSKPLSFGTGNIGGNYYTYGNAYAQCITGDNEKLTVNVKATAGSAANLRLIQQGFLDIAVTQSDTLMEAYNGEGTFSGNACEGVRALAGLYIEECQIVVRADSEIYAVSDLYKKRVSVGEEESGVVRNAEQLMAVNGISPDMVQEQHLSFSDSAAALENGAIDAFFVTAGAPTTAVSELSREMEIRVLSLDDTTIERITKQYQGYTVCTIPADTYAGQTEEIRTVGVKAVLVAGNKLPDKTAKQLVETLFTHSEELRYATSVSALDKTFAVSDIPVPFHKGAAEWYSENGIDVETNANGTVGNHLNAVQD